MIRFKLPCSRKYFPCFLSKNSLFDASDPIETAQILSVIQQYRAAKGSAFTNFPVFFPVSRELKRGDWFAMDCVVSQDLSY